MIMANPFAGKKYRYRISYKKGMGPEGATYEDVEAFNIIESETDEANMYSFTNYGIFLVVNGASVERITRHEIAEAS